MYPKIEEDKKQLLLEQCDQLDESISIILSKLEDDERVSNDMFIEYESQFELLNRKLFKHREEIYFT